jgi:hypothetical protein
MNQFLIQKGSESGCKGKIYLAVMEWKLLIFSQGTEILLVIGYWLLVQIQNQD